jgi:HlyD family secretion protein
MNIKSTFLRWGLPILALILFIAAVRFIFTGKPEQTSVPAVQTPATVPINKIKDGVVAGAGVVQPSSELVAIAAPVPGIVKSVDVSVGNEVKRGQLLFTIDDRQTQADLLGRQTALQLAKQNLRTAEIDSAERAANLKLYESIGDKRAMTEDELTRRRFAVQSSNARLEASRASVRQGEAELEQTRIQLALRSVRAPIDGTILQIKVRVGEFAPAMQLTEPLITLGSTKPLHVKIDIDEADINRVNIGASATISPKGASSKAIEAKFVRVDPLVVPKRSLTNSASERVDTRVLQILYQLPDNIGSRDGFFVGQQVDAFVPTTKSSAQKSAALSLNKIRNEGKFTKPVLLTENGRAK